MKVEPKEYLKVEPKVGWMVVWMVDSMVDSMEPLTAVMKVENWAEMKVEWSDGK